ncbi:carbon-nitrogen hydrolase family protein [Peribacillus alkalitolerans]|uniref:carbon-nitrogen hydrolase family protein n=1 Tax=Peribacillus alkalitolerans TaxID=1550385 RepID=UPI0013D2F42A|nr:carbon-nitrogen hydrolase family protein [Peribacillus alkalitolerans]
MRIGLAQTRFPATHSEGIISVKKMIMEASEKNCDIICFPESILPGLRGVGYEVEAYNHEFQEHALENVCLLARMNHIGVILPMEWKDEVGMQLVAFVISKEGVILGYQTKNQIDLDEDQFGYQPGTGRQIFKIDDVNFGIVICHEGWRYPETVRWAARQGASIVFHPQFTGEVENPEFYDAAMVCRSVENNIYFASVNYSLENQNSTSALISPSGERLCKALPNVEELLIFDIEPKQASRLLAMRLKPELL